MYGITVLVVYAALMILTTTVFTDKEVNAERFHVTNRNVGVTLSSISIAATWIWAPALFVSAEKAYGSGIAGLFWFLVPNVLCLLIFIPFAKKIRQRMPRGITLSDYMGKKYQSGKVRGAYLFQLSTLAIFSTGVQLLAGGGVLCVMTGLPFWLMTIMLAVTAFSYSHISGIKASVVTDVVQLVIIIGGCLLIAPWIVRDTGGIETVIKGLGGITGEYGSIFSPKGKEVFFAFGLSTSIGLISGPFGDQSFWQRTFTMREKDIGKIFAIGAVLFAIVPVCMGTIGFAAAGSGFIAENQSMVNFEMILSVLPKWTLFPFLMMILSGLLSTIDANMCSIASLTSDFKGSNIRTAKTAMIMLLILGIGIANIPGMTITYLFMIYGILRASTLLPTVLTLTDCKLSSKGVYTGVFAALILGLPIFVFGTLNNLSTYKTIGCLTTVLMSGVLAYLITRGEARKC